MNRFETILCFCPTRRFFLASLVLSTWPGVHWILTDNDAIDPAGVDAIMVMDEFVTADRVARFEATHPVLVLAWNGRFEIQRYQQQLSGHDNVTYTGTDETLSGFRYRPTIDGNCPYASWRQDFQHKRRFSVRGSARYRSNWFRTQLSASRWWRLLVSSAGALLSRRDALRQTVESGFITDRIVWAGNCQLDVRSLGLAEHVTAVRALQSPNARLRQALAVIDVWREIAERSVSTERAHEAVYVTNTILRWAVLDFLLLTARPNTWFFGQDNLGLDLDFELYVYNLTPNRRIAYLDMGGKTAETFLYPRSLHLLVRQCSVIAFPTPETASGREELATKLERLSGRLVGDRHAFFDEVEQRRRLAYASLPPNCTLAEAQRRIWTEFC